MVFVTSSDEQCNVAQMRTLAALFQGYKSKRSFSETFRNTEN